MRYPAISHEQAREALRTYWEDQGEVRAREHVYWKGEGSRFDWDKARRLRELLTDVQNGLPKPLPKTFGHKFESQASPVVHSTLALSYEAATDPEFWLWLTFGSVGGEFLDLVTWRFGGGDMPANTNYGISSDPWEGLFARLWWRSEAAYDPKYEDPYELARRGDIDIWRSHIIRQDYGRVWLVARSLIKYVYADDNPGSARLTGEEIRKLAPRLRQLNSSVSFELMDEDQIRSMIDALVGEIRAMP